MRVRQILNVLSATERRSLLKLIPNSLHKLDPLPETQRYPSALLSNLPKDEAYSLLGHIAEHLLRLPSAAITISSLINVIHTLVPDLQQSILEKISKSPTTSPFLSAIQHTRALLEKILVKVEETPIYEPEVQNRFVQGHPDITTSTQIFEIKLTGQLEKNWPDFLLQAFAYAAILQNTKTLHIILPLQKYIWTFNLNKWTPITNRTLFLDILNTAVITQQTTALHTLSVAKGIYDSYGIGSHTSKTKSIASTIAPLSSERPWQIFLNSGMSTKTNIKLQDIQDTAAIVAAQKYSIFVHAPYLLNLAIDSGTADNYVVTCAQEQLRLSAQMGFKGVVIHVGKSTSQPVHTARLNMITNIRAILKAATSACPLLLETPAGQGTEMLTGWDDFIGLVQEIDDPRLGICVDTCHVFAAGHDPINYLERILSTCPQLLKLVHFNDSEADCGACVDRHASAGSGKIGATVMRSIGRLLAYYSIPAVVE
jgi:deoxyribonuclease-4